MLRVDEVAVSAAYKLGYNSNELTIAVALEVKPALSLPEVRHRAVLSVNLAIVVVSPIFLSEAGLGLLLSGEFEVHISYHVLADVVSYHHVEYLAELAEFNENLFVELFEVLRCFQELFLRYLEAIRECNGSSGILVQLEEEQGLAERRLVVLARAAIAVPARSDLVIKRTVHPIQALDKNCELTCRPRFRTF